MILCAYKKHIVLIRQLKNGKKEWKKLGGGESTWNCGSSNTRGVGILLRKHFSFKLTETFRDQNSSH
jgi:hypothetical protein